MASHSAPQPNSNFASEQKSLSDDKSPLLDQRVFDGFRPQGPRDIMTGYMNQLIVRHGRESLTQLRDAAERNDLETIGQTAHRWRGSCLSLGLLRLGNALSKLDHASRPAAAEYVEQTKRLIPILESVFAESCAELEHLH